MEDPAPNDVREQGDPARRRALPMPQRATLPEDEQHSADRRRLSRIAWMHPEEMDFSEWAAAGRRLGQIGRGSQWWIGDWLLFGTARFGERYVEASKITGYDPKSLRNMRYVASQFDVSLRRDELNWSHHALLAGLAPDEQVYWLDRAAADRLSVEDLRCELRSARRGNYAGADADHALPAAGAAVVVCPNCGSDVPVNATTARARLEA